MEWTELGGGLRRRLVSANLRLLSNEFSLDGLVGAVLRVGVVLERELYALLNAAIIYKILSVRVSAGDELGLLHLEGGSLVRLLLGHGRLHI